jgi:hypothetical protein
MSRWAILCRPVSVRPHTHSPQSVRSSVRSSNYPYYPDTPVVSNSGPDVALIAGVTAGVVGILIAAVVVFLLWRQRRKRAELIGAAVRDEAKQDDPESAQLIFPAKPPPMQSLQAGPGTAHGLSSSGVSPPVPQSSSSAPAAQVGHALPLRGQKPHPLQRVIQRDGETIITWGDQGVLDRHRSTRKAPLPAAAPRTSSPHGAAHHSASPPSTDVGHQGVRSQEAGSSSRAADDMTTTELMGVLRERLENERARNVEPEDAPPSYEPASEVPTVAKR